MKKILTRAFAASSAMALSILALSPAVFAQSSSGSSNMFQANIQQLNNSGVSGTLTATLNGDKLTVDEHLTGVLAGSPHAQHLHFSDSASHTCPTADVIKDNQPGDANDKPFAFGNDKVLESVEARPNYGPPSVSLTTNGDTSPKSALAVKRFPTGKGGTIDYQRTVTLDNDQIKHLKDGQFVVATHGLDLNGDGKYSVFNGDQTKSALAAAAAGDNNFPLEGTAPNGCGVLTAMPSGAPSTGSGSTSGIENASLLAIGGAVIVASGLTLALTQRKATSRNK